MTHEFMDVRDVAALLGWTVRMVDDTADAGNVSRSMNRREIALRPFLEYAARRCAFGDELRANVRAWRDARIDWNAPLIVDVPRDQWIRGTRSVSSTKSASSNIIETVDPTTGRRTISRRDFFTGE